AELLQPDRAHDRAGGDPLLPCARRRPDPVESPGGGGPPRRGAARDGGGARRASDRQRTAIEKHRAALEAYEGLCRELGEAPADVALAWLLHQPAVTAPIIGPRTIEQLTGSLRAL